MSYNSADTVQRGNFGAFKCHYGFLNFHPLVVGYVIATCKKR